MRFAVAALTLASFGVMFAAPPASTPGEPQQTQARKKHKKHDKKNPQTDQTKQGSSK